MVTHGQVHGEIRRWCHDRGIKLDYVEWLEEEYGPWEGEQTIDGGYESPYRGEPPTIELMFLPSAAPLAVWWTFLHELGHWEQDRESPSFNRTYDSSWKAMYHYEQDAWSRAIYHAMYSRWRPDDSFHALVEESLAIKRRLPGGPASTEIWEPAREFLDEG